MNRRPDAEMNGKAETNGKGPHPRNQTPRRRLPQPPPQQRPSLLPLVAFCLTVGLAAIMITQNLKPPVVSPTPSLRSEAFRWAVNRAISAAELTQTASSQAEWNQVVSWWKESIDLMKTVPLSSPNYQVAQEKLLEYGRNLQYAQSKAQSTTQTQPAASPDPEGVWTIDSRRAEVLKLQGKPTQTDRYDSMCKEVLHYGKSTVELSNGMVARYQDFDRNLRAAPENSAKPAVTQAATSWTLGSSKEEVFAIQGTPSRITHYDYSNRELLYYDNSIVDLANGKVIGYDNLDRNLKVHIIPVVPDSSNNNQFWTLDSARDDIFRIQGTPSQIVLDDAACTEVLHYGNSTVELKNGFLASYNNLENNLKVRVK
jgi:hypothetical protein